MKKLTFESYEKVKPLIRSNNELSVCAVLGGYISGEVYVNDDKNPSAALIKTCECNYLAGCSDNADFNNSLATRLDFWDQATPDTDDWKNTISQYHANKFIREYTRRHYQLDSTQWSEFTFNLPSDLFLEEVNLYTLESDSYENAERVLEWAANFKDKDDFMKHGVGYYIRDEHEILSWSLSDCMCCDQVAIGVHTDDAHRKKGLGKIVVQAAINACFLKGFKQIDWLCVDFNTGSIALAEKCGFQLLNRYSSYASYPPCENILDLQPQDWNDWGDYYSKATTDEPRLLREQVFCYIKANEVLKAIKTIERMLHEWQDENFEQMLHFIQYCQSIGLSSNFLDSEWTSFVENRIFTLNQKENTLFNEQSIISQWNANMYEQLITETNDVEFLLSIVDSKKKKILEIACGSGRILVPLAKLGHTVTGLDFDQYMLDKITPQAHEMDNITIRKADMIRDSWGSGFDVVVLAANILFNIVSDIEYEKAQQILIQKAGEALASGGYIYIDYGYYMHPEDIFGNPSEYTIWEGCDNAGNAGRMSLLDSTYDKESGITTFIRRFDITLTDGTKIKQDIPSLKHFATLEQIKNWLCSAGFVVEQEYGNYDRDPISESTNRAIIWAKKI